MSLNGFLTQLDRCAANFKFEFKLTLILLCFVTALCPLAQRSAAQSPQADTGTKWLEQTELPPLPDAEGFAGMFAGVSDGALIVAGGANFPNGRPWEGGQKIWHDRIFVLESPAVAWKVSETKLPRPIAYGLSMTHDNQVICIGGGDADRHYADVFSLRWIDGAIEISREGLPPLPVSNAVAAGAIIKGKIYIAGGLEKPEPESPTASHTFWMIDLNEPIDARKWRALDPWPGPARHQAVAGVKDGHFYLFSGVEMEPGDEPGSGRRVRPYLSDAYRYDPGENTWQRLPDMPRPAAAPPGPAISLGQAHLVILGGVDGLGVAGDLSKHTGFTRKILGYHTVANEWVEGGLMPEGASRVTAPVTDWQGGWVIPSGEIRPGVRSPKVYLVKAPEDHSAFRTLDWVILGVYLAGMVGIGAYCSRNKGGTEDFFLAGRRIPWWAAGLSIFGTQLSAITFMTVPAIAFSEDWTRMIGNFMIVAIAPIVIFFYLPFYRRLNVSTSYEYLEKRFNLAARILSSAMFMLFQLGRMGIVLFLPAIALQAVTGIDVYVCIVLMGALATLYTVLGGIEAVIWTDVVQVFVLMGGALLCLVMILTRPEIGGTAAAIQTASDAGRLHLFDFDWDLTRTTFIVMAVGTLFTNLMSYTADQTVIQRYLTTKDEKAAARSIWANAALTVPTALLFFGVGSALFVFFKQVHPQEILPAQSDQILPWFIVHHLPAGISGLVIAGVFAASMSSLDSSMNSIATAYITDFHRRLLPATDDRANLRLAQWVTVLMGIIGTGSALLIARLEIKYIFDHYNAVIGLFGGSLAGIFILAVFTTRTSSAGALIGFAAGAIAPLALRQTDINVFLYGAAGALTCIVVGYGISLFLPGSRPNLAGLTVHTINDQPALT